MGDCIKWTEPTLRDLTRVANKYKSKYLKEAPLERKIIITKLNKEMLGETKGNYKRWKIGTLQILPLLDINKAHIACRKKEP